MFDWLGLKPEEVSALASVGQLVAAVLVAGIGFYISWRIARIPGAVQTALEGARRDSEKRQNAVRLTDHVYSVGFHKEVTVLVWEIYVNWRYWEGPRGDAYRNEVVTGYVNYSNKYCPFKSPYDLPQVGHNQINFGDHFHPRNNVQTGLAEHQALTCWLEYWGNVNTMIDQQLVDLEATKHLLSDWYQYWLEFMIELRVIVKGLHDLRNRSCDASKMDQEPTPRWITELENLEKRFYAMPNGGLFPWYNSRQEDCKRRAEGIIKMITDRGVDHPACPGQP